jgi:hypothetical protein
METGLEASDHDELGKKHTMKKILVAALAASVLATPALAESSDTATINLKGNVEQICTVVPNATFAGANMPNRTYSRADDTVTASWDFVIANTNDPTQANIGQTNQAFFSVAFQTFCNDNFTWTTTYEKGALTNLDSAPAGFTNSLAYTVDLKQIGTGAMNITGEAVPTAGGSQSYQSDAFNGISQVDFNVKPSTTPPVAGDYTETVTMTFAAD